MRLRGGRSSVAVFMVLALLSACGTRVPASERLALRTSQQGTASQQSGADGVADGGVASDIAGDQVASDAAGGAQTDAGTNAGGATGSGSGATGGAATGGATAAGQFPPGAPINVGAVGTVSGLAGDALTHTWAGLRLWASWVNAHGGVAGHPVKLIIVDDQDDPGHNAAAVRQLIQEDHVVAFVGSFAPLTFSAGVPVLEQFKVPAIGGDSSDPGWFRSPMAFPINSINIPIGRAPALYVSQHRPETKAAVFYVNEAAATAGVADAFISAWQGAGKSVVVKQGVSLATPDFTGSILQAQSAGADVVFVTLDSASCQRFWDAARRQHYKPLFISSGCDGQSLKGSSDMTAGNLFFGGSHAPMKAGTPATDEFLAAVARFNSNKDLDVEQAGSGWMSGKLFEAAVAAAGGKVTTADVIRGLHSLTDGTLGGLNHQQTWPPGPHPAGVCGFVYFYGPDSKPVQVTPDFVC